MPKKNDILTVEITDITGEGMGIGKADGYVLFVPACAVGDICEVKVLKALKSYGYAKIERIIKPSPERTETDCAVFGRCGGCNTELPDTEETSNNTESSADKSTNIPHQDAPKSNIEEKKFVLESDGYKLNAAYTYINDGNAHPAVLLIAGSGPSDYDETLGALKPFKDIANGLAKKGINSLRVDKRTLSYAAEFDIKCGIKEEYLDDCNIAVEYLKSQNVSGLYLLGHSLGGQIAAELAASIESIDGIILFNSSARHLADIACAQYSAFDPANKEAYITYATAAKNATATSAKGYYYYSASDYYWASYNQMDTAQNIADANIKTLIINSKSDKQSFDEDIELWQALFSDSVNVSICVYDDISHFGYKIDTTDPRVNIYSS